MYLYLFHYPIRMIIDALFVTYKPDRGNLVFGLEIFLILFLTMLFSVCCRMITNKIKAVKYGV